MDFYINELEEIISIAKERNSSGNDLVNHSLLKLLPMITIQKLLYIFNKILREASFPIMWRNYNIILLPQTSQTHCSIFMYLKITGEVY